MTPIYDAGEQFAETYRSVRARASAVALVGAANRTHTAEQALRRIVEGGGKREPHSVCPWCGELGAFPVHAPSCPAAIAAAALGA